MSFSLIASLFTLLLASKLALAAEAMAAAVAEPVFVKPDPPGCPLTIESIANFDLVRIQKIWYAQYITVNISSFGCEGCWQEAWTNNAPGAVYTLPCCQRNGAPYCDNYLGAGPVTYTDVPGLFYYTLFLNPDTNLNAFFLGTDYETYLLGYICGLREDGSSFEEIYAYSNTPVPAPGFDDIIFGLLDKNGLSRCLANPVSHGDWCNYLWGCPASPEIEPFAMRPM